MRRCLSGLAVPVLVPVVLSSAGRSNRAIPRRPMQALWSASLGN